MVTVLEIAFVAYPVTDVMRARSFYEGILKLAPASDYDTEKGSWIEYEIGAGTLAITNMGADQWKPSPLGPSAALEVEDFDAAIAALRESRTNFVVEPFASPVCRLAIISDPDGNSLTIHKRNAA